MGKGGKHPAALVETRCSGHFKSFNKVKGWGFISCTSFPDDVFVSYNTAPTLADLADQFQDLAAQPVTFLLTESASTPGRYEGREIMIGDARQSAHGRGIVGKSGCGKHTNGKGKRSAAALVGQVCSGNFKSFNMAKGWGFINCNSFPDDVFVSFNTAPELAEVAGDLASRPVTFMLANSASNPGQYEANNVMFNDLRHAQPRYLADISHGMASAGPSGKGKSKQSPAANVQSGKGGKGNRTLRPSAPVGKRCSGYFKSFNMAKRWGFVICDGLTNDVFVSLNTAPELVEVAEMLGDLAGRRVTFLLANNVSNPGQYEAREIMFDDVIYGEGDDSEQQLCNGTFKSFNATNGWGFLTCPEIDGDVFVSYKTAPELKGIVGQLGQLQSQSVSFSVQESKSTPGSYEATTITLTAGSRKGGSKGKYRSKPY